MVEPNYELQQKSFIGLAAASSDLYRGGAKLLINVAVALLRHFAKRHLAE